MTLVEVTADRYAATDATCNVIKGLIADSFMHAFCRGGNERAALSQRTAGGRGSCVACGHDLCLDRTAHAMRLCFKRQMKKTREDQNAGEHEPDRASLRI
jgi:hypothetical protein